MTVAMKYHQRQLVDGSGPAYFPQFLDSRRAANELE